MTGLQRVGKRLVPKEGKRILRGFVAPPSDSEDIRTAQSPRLSGNAFKHFEAAYHASPEEEISKHLEPKNSLCSGFQERINNSSYT